MIFSTLNLNKDEPIYLQLKKHIAEGIKSGQLKKGSKLPSTREAAALLNISRNSVISAYEELESHGIISTKRGVGTFVNIDAGTKNEGYFIDYSSYINDYGKTLRSEDIIKSEPKYIKGMISFKSISPEPSLFNLDDFKRALLDAYSSEGANLLNYGYAKGYAPLIKYFMDYMKGKGVSTYGKDILITNGYTEAFDLILSSMTTQGDIIVCEEPTHNTALKLMKAHGLKIIQIPLDNDGMDISMLKDALSNCSPKMAYLIPSYNNPTGIVTKAKRRQEIYELFKEHSIPVIEDGFNEELLYSSSPIQPMAAFDYGGNGIIYIGSLSKILFPGLRIGWIFADNTLIDVLESVKRGRNIHSSFLDQSAFYYYLKSGAFNKYLKSVRKYYKDKYLLTLSLIKKHIPYEYITGEGGLHIFIKLKNGINARKLLDLCYKDGVIFMPGDIFYNDKSHSDTLRLGIGRVSDNDIEKGIRIIAKNIDYLSGHR